MQHYVGLVIFLVYPIAYGWYNIVNTGMSPLGMYYYYNTLITQTREDGTLLFLTSSKAVRDEGFVLLGGSDVLIRAKDLYIIMGMKLFTEKMASTINLSVVLAHIVNGRLTPMRRVSYIALYLVSRRWNGRISYPGIS
ncbi:uncharacterized protein PITG_15680 [Phytophthora infestans T30-4]|uniref:Uncharacterized protein n=1 Tax=Phytophthora infestans (strain T30-4) TaxID=403677 RepID=D0NSB4_PHYIT|nr:uncharacterized protein PITG_15680 [Phytophthora infestans T30-4]EEY64459.1 conserved hypothetical protein [Phytophthora infestans T30-4]|eukprot:XP_002897962.1 conserved hypothetical protein [Phytophthora infestans T30-4]